MKKDEQTHAIIGAAMEVHRVWGCGFLEAVYHEALAEELELNGIPFRQQVEIPIFYKGKKLMTPYRANFICFEQVVIEIKALDGLSKKDKSQILNYLKATKLERGLLLNFGAPSLQMERMILTPVDEPVSF